MLSSFEPNEFSSVTRSLSLPALVIVIRGFAVIIGCPFVRNQVPGAALYGPKALPASQAQALPAQTRPGLANLCFVRFLHGLKFRFFGLFSTGKYRQQ